MVFIVQLTPHCTARSALGSAILKCYQLEHIAKDAFKMADPIVGNKYVETKF